MDEEEVKNRRGDGRMAASAANYVYKAVIKGNEKSVPPISKEKLASFKVAVDKYLRKK